MKIFFIILLMLGWTQAVLAQKSEKPPRIPFLVRWVVTPVGHIPTGDIMVKPWTKILEARLLPTILYKLDTAVYTLDNQLLLPEGQHLVPMQSPLFIACTIKHMNPTGFSLFWLGKNQHMCLIDTDKDGKFDEYFVLLTGDVGFPLGIGYVPKKRLPLSPVGYTSADPKVLTDSPRIQVRFGWHASLVDQNVFQTCLENARLDRNGCFGQDITIKGTKLPGNITALGAQILVKEKVGNQVRVEVLSDTLPQLLILY